MTIDAVELTKALVQCPSVTPAEAGALDVVADAAASLGFRVERLTFGDANPVENLFATLGNQGRHLAFSGHVDVVPPGDSAAWRHDPFDATIADGLLYGRGSADMKSGVACFLAAVATLSEKGELPDARISLLITCDEEGDAVNGTKPLAAWCDAQGHSFDGCLVGEPTSIDTLGDNAKLGRRGSATADLTVLGTQGHTAYGHRAHNAAHGIVRLLNAVVSEPIDHGTKYFQPTSLEITTIDIGNPAPNVVPGEATARFNMRYNDSQSTESLETWLRSRMDPLDERYELTLQTSGDAFLTEEGELSRSLAQSIKAVTGQEIRFSTDGGTSDARFIKDYCPVVEFGLPGQTMHKIDEHVRISDIRQLTDVYAHFIKHFLSEA